MIFAQPGLHAIQVTITDYEYYIFRPERIIWHDMLNTQDTLRDYQRDQLFKNPASASTVETPRRLRVPSPSFVLLSHDALMTIASEPEALGDENTAYAFVPWIS